MADESASVISSPAISSAPPPGVCRQAKATATSQASATRERGDWIQEAENTRIFCSANLQDLTG